MSGEFYFGLKVGIIFGASMTMLAVGLGKDYIDWKHARKLRRIRERGL